MSKEFVLDLKDLIPDYLKRRREDFAKLEAAMSSGDMATIKTIAHQTKGHAKGYGFPELGDIAESLDASAKADDVDACRQHVAKWKTWIEALPST